MATVAEKDRYAAMKPEDQAALDAAGAAWNSAKTQAEKDAAHAEAERIREKYNYTGGTDGSQVKDLPKSSSSGSNKSTGGSTVSQDIKKPTTSATGVDSRAEEAYNNMKPGDKTALDAAGATWTEANKMYQQTGEQKYKDAMDAAHRDAEAIRARYNYSGGDDGSKYIELPGMPEAPEQAPVQNFTSPVPDFTGLLDSWLETAKQQQELGIDYATQKGVDELERAKEDAELQFQTQQDQVSKDEAKALDNQALYAEARGDRGGIGEAQYAQIQATAMQNRRAINTARTKLATDTARQIADLRAQGAFEKADALLSLTQTYLGQLIELQQWGAEYSLDVAQFNAQLQQWQAEFELAVSDTTGIYKGQQTLAAQKAEQAILADSGAAALAVGVRPSAAQQAAMGYTDAQVDAELAAYKLAQAAGVKGSGGGGNPTGTPSSKFSHDALYAAGVTPDNVMAYLAGTGDLSQWEAEAIAEAYIKAYDSLSERAKADEEATAWANAEIDRGSLWELGLGMFSGEAIADMVARGELIQYLDTDGFIRFRRPGSSSGILKMPTL